MGALAATMRHHSPAFNALIRHPNKEPFLFGDNKLRESRAEDHSEIQAHLSPFPFLKLLFAFCALLHPPSSPLHFSLPITSNARILALECLDSSPIYGLTCVVTAAFLFLVFGSLELDDMATAEIAAATSLASISFSSFSSPESLLLRLLRLTPTLT